MPVPRRIVDNAYQMSEDLQAVDDARSEITDLPSTKTYQMDWHVLVLRLEFTIPCEARLLDGGHLEAQTL